MEMLRKKNQTEILEIKSPLNKIQNTIESDSSRLEQVEENFQGSKTKYILKKKPKNS
jgi:hypothetical protein